MRGLCAPPCTSLQAIEIALRTPSLACADVKPGALVEGLFGGAIEECAVKAARSGKAVVPGVVTAAATAHQQNRDQSNAMHVF